MTASVQVSFTATWTRVPRNRIFLQKYDNLILGFGNSTDCMLLDRLLMLYTIAWFCWWQKESENFQSKERPFGERHHRQGFLWTLVTTLAVASWGPSIAVRVRTWNSKCDFGRCCLRHLWWKNEIIFPCFPGLLWCVHFSFSSAR